MNRFVLQFIRELTNPTTGALLACFGHYGWSCRSSEQDSICALCRRLSQAEKDYVKNHPMTDKESKRRWKKMSD